MNKRNLLAGLAGLLLPALSLGQTYNRFQPANGILVGSPSTYVTTAADSGDVIATWSGVCSSSTYLRGDGTCAAAVPASAALTRVDDTNVTLTLGGTPSSALLQATSLTLGWTGTLAPSRGGLGMSTVTDDTIAVANGTIWQSKAVPDCDTSTSVLQYDTSTNAFSCATAGVSFANPSASIGLTANNGVATTAMRSDATPALSQAIAPTWTNNHVFTANTRFSGGSAPIRMVAADSLGDNFIQAYSSDGTTARWYLGNGSASDNSVNLSNETASAPLNLTANSGVINMTGAGVLVGSASGGAQGSGTLNATGVYDDGVLLANQVGANPTASVGLSAVNGAAGTFMRSDAAPALDQSITPTWSGLHTFSGASAQRMVVNSSAAAGPYISFQRGGVGVSDIGVGTNCGGSFTSDSLCLAARVGNPLQMSANGVTAPQWQINTSGNTVQTGVALGPAGSASAPTYSLSADPNTGMYSDGADSIAFATGGSHRLSIDSTTLTTSLSGTFTGRQFSAGGTTNASTAVQLCHSSSGYAVIGINVACTASSNVYNYGVTDVAGIIDFSNGSSRRWDFKTAASGTGGTAISWTTQATLDSSGNLNTTGRTTAAGLTSTAFTSLAGSSAPLRMTAADSSGDNYIQAYSSDGSTGRWFLGNGGSSDNNVQFANESSGSTLTLQTAGSGNINMAPGGTTQLAVTTSGLTVASPTGGAMGSGTINATGLYINGVPVSGGETTTGSFTGTLTGLTTSPGCSMEYRKTGTLVFLYNTANCTGTSNANTFTMTGLPAAIQPARTVTCVTTGQQDNGTVLLGAADIAGGGSTVTMLKQSVSGSNIITGSSLWTASGTKGITSVWTCIYDLDS